MHINLKRKHITREQFFTLLFNRNVLDTFICILYIWGNVSSSGQFSCSVVSNSMTTWTAAHQASLSKSWSLLKFMSIVLVMPSNHLILCHPLLLQPSIFPIIRVCCNVLVLRIRWPKYKSFSFSISTSNEYSGVISSRMTGWISLKSKGLSRVFSNTTVQKHQFFGAQLYSPTNIHT